tara:strand:+ start:407 stop:2254 length:1848 start_codon:yes stop_codon:yes gene_type:complete
MSSSKTSDLRSSPEKIRLRYTLENSQIFGDLPADLLTDLVDVMEISVIAGGNALYLQGQESDSLAIVISGRFIAQLDSGSGNKKLLGEMASGNCIGELGMILQQPRVVDVIAIRDSSVAYLSRACFERLLTSHALPLNRAITRRVFEFSLNKNQQPANIGATNFAIVPLSEKLSLSGNTQGRVDVKRLSSDLSMTLSHQNNVFHLTPEAGNELHSDKGALVESSHRLSDLEQEYNYLLFETPLMATAWSHFAIRQADQLILVANSDTDPSTLLLDDETGQALKKSKAKASLVLLHPDHTKNPTVDSRWRETFNLERIYPLRLNNQTEIERLTRFITGKAIGLVLGGGGARGLAHVGVLKALEEAQVPIDIICGNSMGALIGAQYANGTPVTSLLKNTKKFILAGDRPTLPFFSLLAGFRIKKGLRRLFNNTTIETLWRPFLAVSCNLSRANIHVHKTGALWQAVLASNSPAGILPPVILNGEFLVDAALLDNVPVKAMRAQNGIGLLIAVDVDVKEELKIDPAIKILSPWHVIRQRLFKKGEPRLPSIMDLLHRSGHLGGLAHREESIALADHYLQPPVSGFSLMAYGKSEEIVETGYFYTMEHINEIKRSLAGK